MGATFLYFLLLGLCSVGLSESTHPLCKSKYRLLLKQKLHIEHLILKFKISAKYLQNECSITTPEISILPIQPLDNSSSTTASPKPTPSSPVNSALPITTSTTIIPDSETDWPPFPDIDSQWPSFPEIESAWPPFPEGGSKWPPFPDIHTKFPPFPESQTNWPPFTGTQPKFPPFPESQTNWPPFTGTQPKFPPFPESQTNWPPFAGTQTRWPPLPETHTRWPPLPETHTRWPPLPETHTRWPPLPESQVNWPKFPESETKWPPFPETQPKWPPASGIESKWPPNIPNMSTRWPLPLPTRPKVQCGQSTPGTNYHPGFTWPDFPTTSKIGKPYPSTDNLNPWPIFPPDQSVRPKPDKIVECCTAQQIIEDAKLTTVEIIKKYGYKVQTHFVKTKDGYILCLHRLPNSGRQPILLVHGLMSSSASWVQMGPKNGLAYILFEQGYDVWLLNTRGNVYSKQHENAGMDPKDYWNFSFHEIGIYDLPPTIDMIVGVTQYPWIQYIGHGQGSTAFFVMCSEIPRYASKVTLMQALSPSVYMENSYSPVLKFLALFKGKFEVLLNLLGGYQIAKENNLIAQFKNQICSDGIASKLCAVFEFVTCGFGWNQFNASFTPVVLGHSSQGASSIQVYHYAQMLSSVKFQRYDRGPLLNYAYYQSNSPPAYNLTQVQCNVALHHGFDDWLSTHQDVEKLEQQLPGVVDSSHITTAGFSHYDYILSKNVIGTVYGRLVTNCHKYRRIKVIKVTKLTIGLG